MGSNMPQIPKCVCFPTLVMVIEIVKLRGENISHPGYQIMRICDTNGLLTLLCIILGWQTTHIQECCNIKCIICLANPDLGKMCIMLI